jgi:ABC-type bacteriocin/lantibiotic exporter with double-glycine peptidase domain
MESILKVREVFRASATEGSVQLSDVKFGRNPQIEPVVDIQSLNLLHGERLFVGGSSGSGKTILLGLHLPAGLPTLGELFLASATVVAGGLVGLIPACRSYRYSLSDGLTMKL